MIKINELFSGIGAQVAAFKRLQIPHEVVGISEIDKYAIQSYEAINGTTRNYGDITKIPFLDYADLWTYSSPCQDFSTAGKQQGIYNADGSLTRSGLLKHVERLLETSVALGNQPKYLLMENVKGLVSKKFKPDFLKWLDKLEQLGYNNYWQVLNAKDYGIPQNRERVFVVSIRKDVDTNGYTFPTPVPLEKRLKDMLEPVVDEKYYLNDEKVKKFIENFREPETSYCIDANYWKGTTADDYLKKHRRQLIKEPLACASRGRNPENPSDRTAGIATEQRLEINNTGCSNTLTSVQKDNYVVEPQVIQLGNIVNTGNWDNPQRGRIDSPSGCSPALNTCQGGQREPKIVIGATQKNAYVGSIENYSPCLTSAMGMGGGQIPMLSNGYRIRKLTPKECWHLMGFTDVEFECAKLSGVSNSQLYKQAGNSIVVDVLAAIFRNLFLEKTAANFNEEQLDLFGE